MPMKKCPMYMHPRDTLGMMPKGKPQQHVHIGQHIPKLVRTMSIILLLHNKHPFGMYCQG